MSKWTYGASSNANALDTSSVNFAETLSRLIEQSPHRTNRRPIWESSGISSATLSQYCLGKARPRFETLIALARFFGVTIDYLVTGREMRQPQDGNNSSVEQYVDSALNGLQSKISRRAYLTARVGQLLVEQIDSAVDRAQVMPIGGMITVDDGIQLELHSLATYVWNSHFEYDVIQLADGGVATGRFAPIVASNLMTDPPRPYRFLLNENPDRPLAPLVHAYQRMLREEFGVGQDRLKFCEFRKTTAPIIFGSCIYRLDLASLQHDQPALMLAINEHMSQNGEIAYSSSADNDTRVEILLSSDRVPAAITTFQTLWNGALPW